MEGYSWQEPEADEPLTPAETLQELKERNQKALEAAWEVFKVENPTEQHAVQTLYNCCKDEDLIACHHCGHRVVEHDFGSRSVRCTQCRRKSWFTAGTIFSKAKRLRPRLAAIYLLSQGISFSAAELRRLSGIAYSSSWGLIYKISQVIRHEPNTYAQSLPSACFKKIIARRSSETPAGKHPYAEEEERQRLARTRSKTKPSATPTEQAAKLGPAESRIFTALTSTFMHVDEICSLSDLSTTEVLPALSMLTIAKLVTASGSTYRQAAADNIAQDAARSLSDDLLDSANNVIDLVIATFQGISRKHLEMYLSRYWCYMDRARWGGQQLLRTCLRTSARALPTQTITKNRATTVELFVAPPPDWTDPELLAAAS